MGISPLAVTISGLLGDVAVVAGIAAALASAVLATVVLGQGREVRRLQEELDAETNRAHAAESALAVEVASVGRVATTSPAAVPQQQKAAAVPASAAVAAVEVEEEEIAEGPGFTGPEISSGSPALGSATMAPVVAARIALAEEEFEDDEFEEEPSSNQPQPSGDRPAPIVIPSPVLAASAAAAAGEGALGQPSTAAAGGLGRSPRPPQPLSGGTKRRNPWLVALIAVVVVGVVVVGLSQVLGGSDSSTQTKSGQNSNVSSSTSGGSGAIVAVLNGTPINGLAGQVAAELKKDGFRQGRTATAANQQSQNTVVAYMPGHAVDAEDVAKALGVKSNVVAASEEVQAIACPDPAKCTAEVIVTVGADSTR